MSNRVIKDSIKRSPQIDSLTWFEEVVFYRLIVTADDYGCLDGRTVLLKNELFPTRENVTKKAIDDAISKLVSVGLLCKYTVSGMPYLFLPTWERHQRIRNKHRKCPEPPEEIYAKCLTADCCQLTADCCQLTASCQPESNPIRIQSESNPNPIQSVDFQEDDGLKRVCKAYEDSIGLMPRHVAAAAMSFIQAGIETDLVIRAIELAAENNARTWSYASAILRNCENKGITTLSAFEADSAAHKAQKAQPEKKSRWKEL